MRSVLLQTTARLVYPVIIVFALFMFFRGHDFPGGGFIGGLIASAGILLVYIALGMRQGNRMYPFSFRLMASVGLICAGVAGFLPLMRGLPFLTSMFVTLDVPLLGGLSLSTVLLFDFGVFLAVLGTIVGVVKALVMDRGRTLSESKEGG